MAIPANAEGRVDLDVLTACLGPDAAGGLVLTNPNTCGLFEREVREFADLVHAVGHSSTWMALISTPSSVG